MPLTMLRKQRDGVQPDGFHYRDRTASGPGIFVFFLSIGAGVAVSAAIDRPWPVLAGILIGLYFLFAIRIAQQWEKIAVLRLGRYRGLRGPGLFLIIPIIDTLSRYVDQRVRVVSVSAESTLTRDTVPVNVDAIIFWLVWDAEKCILEVGFRERHSHERTDRAARIDRPA